jgi:uncharacterized membrane protein
MPIGTGAGPPEPAAGPSTTRLEALSDGIIAIAATLLVIELTGPAPGAPVWPAIRDELPSIAAFVVSFLTILIFWVNHHALFAGVNRTDRGVLFLNGLLLLGISFISFPTAVLGRALGDGHYAGSAAVFYAAVLALTSGTFTALWAYLRAHPQLLEPAVRLRATAALRRSLVGPVLYLVALLVALVNAAAALVVVALVAAYFARAPRGRGAGGVSG